MTSIYRGQWSGQTSDGSLVLANINVNEKKLSGRVSTHELVNVKGKNVPIWTWSFFEGQINTSKKIKGRLYAPSIHEKFGEYLTDEQLQNLKKLAQIEFPDYVDFTGELRNEKSLTIKCKARYPTLKPIEQEFKLSKKILSKSKIKNLDMTWNEFKDYALQQDSGLIYRGQSDHFPLQTTYHRTGYADLIEYLDNVVPQLEHHINSIASHPYNAKDDRSLGALLNLAQHHGYPTPLLDWSKSPYVAAFFAFENEARLKKGGKISIFVFNEKKWSDMAGRHANIRSPNMIVRTMELPGFANPRVLPQQAITMFSNVDDIEDIILSNENSPNDFLTRITIRTSYAKKAMHDLNLMGITWGSMFPGFDGICKQLSFRHFK